MGPEAARSTHAGGRGGTRLPRRRNLPAPPRHRRPRPGQTAALSVRLHGMNAAGRVYRRPEAIRSSPPARASRAQPLLMVRRQPRGVSRGGGRGRIGPACRQRPHEGVADVLRQPEPALADWLPAGQGPNACFGLMAWATRTTWERSSAPRRTGIAGVLLPEARSWRSAPPRASPKAGLKLFWFAWAPRRGPCNSCGAGFTLAPRSPVGTSCRRLPPRLVYVIGAEGEGWTGAWRRRATRAFQSPAQGRLELNVAAATAVFLASWACPAPEAGGNLTGRHRAARCRNRRPPPGRRAPRTRRCSVPSCGSTLSRVSLALWWRSKYCAVLAQPGPGHARLRHRDDVRPRAARSSMYRCPGASARAIWRVAAGRSGAPALKPYGRRNRSAASRCSLMWSACRWAYWRAPISPCSSLQTRSPGCCAGALLQLPDQVAGRHRDPDTRCIVDRAGAQVPGIQVRGDHHEFVAVAAAAICRSRCARAPSKPTSSDSATVTGPR